MVRSLIPIENEANLHRINRFTLNAQMGVPPISEPGVETQVFIPDVKTADIPDIAINDSQLSVIPVIQTQINEARLGREEGLASPPASKCFEKPLVN